MAGSAPHIPGCRDLSLIGERVARSLFSATSDRVGRPVTVTVFPPLSEGRTREDFDHAAATAQRLGAHPSVVTIHEWGHAPRRAALDGDRSPARRVGRHPADHGRAPRGRAGAPGGRAAGRGARDGAPGGHRARRPAAGPARVRRPGRAAAGRDGPGPVRRASPAWGPQQPGALPRPARGARAHRGHAGHRRLFAGHHRVRPARRAGPPQQKPAEITDSNVAAAAHPPDAGPAHRPARPAPGLSRRAARPLSPSPGKRPQQAIEVAWLLQDAQRRNGMAVTEPVVLDLDEIRAPGRVVAADRPGPRRGHRRPRRPTPSRRPPTRPSGPGPHRRR